MTGWPWPARALPRPAAGRRGQYQKHGPYDADPDAVGRVGPHPSPHVILHHQPAGPSPPKPCRPATTVSPARCAVLTSMAAWPYLFAGIPVSDYAAALAWYERLLGSPPSFFPHDTEAVWELAEHRSVFIVQQRNMPATPCTPSSWMTSTPRWPRSLSWDWSRRSGRRTRMACVCAVPLPQAQRQHTHGGPRRL
jgi:hypothetical protein